MGHRCHVPVLVGSVSCPALVDTGSKATLVRPDVVPEGTVLEPTLVKLRTVTGQIAEMKGKGTFVFTVGSLAVTFSPWVAEVKDPCVLGLDFLRGIGCILDLAADMLILPGGQAIQMIPPHNQVFPVVPIFCTAAHSETVNPHLDEIRPSPPTPATQAVMLPDDSALPLQQVVVPLDRREAIRGIWEKNCVGLDEQQKGELWQVLWELGTHLPSMKMKWASHTWLSTILILGMHGPSKCGPAVCP